MYSARGSQSVGVGSYVTQFTNTDPDNYQESILTQVFASSASKPNQYFRKRPLFTAKCAPFFEMRDRNTNPKIILMSLPAYNRMTRPFRSIEDMRYKQIGIKFKNPTDNDAVQNFVTDCKSRFTADENNSIRFKNYFEGIETTQQVRKILDIIFGVIIIITMILCLFSLSSSMSANLLE